MSTKDTTKGLNMYELVDSVVHAYSSLFKTPFNIKYYVPSGSLCTIALTRDNTEVFVLRSLQSKISQLSQLLFYVCLH